MRARASYARARAHVLITQTHTLQLAQGTADRVVPYRHATSVQTLIPHAELVSIEGGPHDITITHPDAVAGALIEFFER